MYSDHLIWIDLEMTGLDPQVDRIIEIATLITNVHLDVIAEGPCMVIHQPESVLSTMDDWNQKQHSLSGLINKVRASDHTVNEAQEKTLKFLRNHVKEDTSPMCGNSICQDRRFLAKWMPELEEFFHYRNLDVSTIKELAIRWAPWVTQGVKKSGQHRALDDIRESIKELKHYRNNFFKLDENDQL